MLPDCIMARRNGNEWSIPQDFSICTMISKLQNILQPA